MKKRIIAVLLVLMLVLSVFASGCTNKEKNQVPAADPAPKTDGPAEEMKVLKVGVDDTYPPMEYVDENNELVGFDIDLAKAIGEVIEMKVEFISNEWDGIFLALEAGKFDVIISSVSMTTERMEKMAFSKPYLANGQLIVTKPENAANITVKSDLKDMTVGVQMSTTSDTALTKFVDENKDNNIQVQRYDDIIQTFSDLKTGRLGAIVVDGMVALDYAKKDPDSYKVSKVNLSNEPIAVAIKKDNTELAEKINGALVKLRENGKLKEISEKWFGADYTSDIDEKLE